MAYLEAKLLNSILKCPEFSIAILCGNPILMLIINNNQHVAYLCHRQWVVRRWACNQVPGRWRTLVRRNPSLGRRWALFQPAVGPSPRTWLVRAWRVCGYPLHRTRPGQIASVRSSIREFMNNSSDKLPTNKLRVSEAQEPPAFMMPSMATGSSTKLDAITRAKSPVFNPRFLNADATLIIPVAISLYFMDWPVDESC